MFLHLRHQDRGAGLFAQRSRRDVLAYVLISLAALTGVVFASLVWSLRQHRNQLERVALEHANAYAEAFELVLEADDSSWSGPTAMVQQWTRADSDEIIRIVRTKPDGVGEIPDAWEKHALATLSPGEIYWDRVDYLGIQSFRYVYRPENASVSWAISVTFPMFRIETLGANFRKSLWMVHLMLLVGGLLVLLWATANLQRNTQLLENSEELYRSLFDHAGEGILILEKGRVVRANARAQKLFGMSGEELLGKTLWDLSPATLDDGRSARETLGAVLAEVEKGRTRSFEWVHTRLGGQRFHAEVTLSAVHHSKKSLLIQAIIRDVSARRRMQEALKRSEAQYRSLVEMSPEGIMLHNGERILYANTALARIVGCKTAADMIGRRILDFILPEDREMVQRRIDALLNRDEPVEAPVIEERIVRLDGSLADVEVMARRVEANGGRALVQVVVRDISERKEREREKAARNERKQRLQETLVQLATVPELFAGDLAVASQRLVRDTAKALGVEYVSTWLLDPDGDEMRCEARYIHSRNEIVRGETFRLSDVPRYRDALQGGLAIDASVATEDPRTADFAPKYLKPLGIQAMLDVPVRVEGKLVGVVCFEDTQPRKRWYGEEVSFASAVAELMGQVVASARRREMELALHEADEKYRVLVEHSLDGIYIYRGRQFLYVNEKTAELTGYTREELYAMDPFTLIHPDDRPLVEEYGRRRQQGLSVVSSYQARVVRKDGEIRYCEFSVSVIELGGKRAVQGTVRDVTERVRAEEELRQSRARFEAIFQNAGDGIYLVSVGKDGTYRYEMANPKVVELLGEDPTGKTPDDLFPPEIASRVKWLFDEIVRTGEPLETEEGYEFKTGHRTVDVARTPLKDASGRVTHIVGMVHDETEKRLLERQLLQAQKMEAIGRLAGGVAHDFNNLLTAIRGYAQLVLMDLPEDDPRRNDIEEIVRTADRAANLTRQLLALSRKQVSQVEVLDLNEIVRDSENLFARLLGEDVRLNLELAPNLWPVEVDRGQLEQVLLNLVVNAREAMPEGGKIVIRTGNRKLQTGRRTAEISIPAGDYVELTVEDTGHGLPEGVREEIFEPFYTTKEMGTGLGLATAYTIVRRHGGLIDVESQEGVGTTFRIFLPRVARERTQPASERKEVTMKRGNATVLLVEDEEVVRGFATRGQGYTVLLAGDGQEALEILEKYESGIDVVVTDVVMPQLGGQALLEAAQAVRPGVRFVLMSGYTDSQIDPATLERADVVFLQKPFEPPQLLEAIEGLLGQEGKTSRPEAVRPRKSRRARLSRDGTSETELQEES
ncbi:MAG: PAS domain S-box protein [Calditrichaeota bacterium]|nr:PAS domain S-box protein [Calditrichota bacterium]